MSLRIIGYGNQRVRSVVTVCVGMEWDGVRMVCAVRCHIVDGVCLCDCDIMSCRHHQHPLAGEVGCGAIQ